MQARSLSRSRCQRRLPACTLVFSAFLRPCGREKARMQAGLRPQSATWLVPGRQARRHLLATTVSPAVPSRASPRPCAPRSKYVGARVYRVQFGLKDRLKYQGLLRNGVFLKASVLAIRLKRPHHHRKEAVFGAKLKQSKQNGVMDGEKQRC